MRPATRQLLFGGAVSPPPPPPPPTITTGWDPATKIAQVDLSGANGVIATSNAANAGNILRATKFGQQGDKFFFEGTFNQWQTAGNTGIGLCDENAAVATVSGFIFVGSNDGHSVGFYTDGHVYFGGTINFAVTITQGEAILFAVDLSGDRTLRPSGWLMHIFVPGHGWGATGAANITGDPGIDVGFITGSHIFPACTLTEFTDGTHLDQVTLNTGAAAFANTAAVAQAIATGYTQLG